jgi:predicted nucleic acid-binding protein
VNRWLLDASVLLAREDTKDAHHADARRLLAGPGAVATVDLAFYEAINVAMVAWKDPEAAQRLRDLIGAIADDGGLVRASEGLVADVVRLCAEHRLSAYDAAYVAAAGAAGARLVSCDVKDLVAAGLAVLPADAVPLDSGPEGPAGPGGDPHAP